MLLKTFNFLILISLAISCTTSPKKSVKPLTARQRQLLYYQKLRQSQWDQITKKSRYHKDTKVTVGPRKSDPVTTPTSKKQVEKKSRIIPVDPHEQRIEMEQLISFHCIKNRIEDCDSVSTQVFETCLDEYAPGDKRLTTCVKKALRKF